MAEPRPLRPDKLAREDWQRNCLLAKQPEILTGLGITALRPYPHGTQADWLMHQDGVLQFRNEPKWRSVSLRAREASAQSWRQFTITEGSERDNIAAEFYLETWGDIGQLIQSAILIDMTKFVNLRLGWDDRQPGGGSYRNQRFLCYDFGKLLAAEVVAGGWTSWLDK